MSRSISLRLFFLEIIVQLTVSGIKLTLVSPAAPDHVIKKNVLQHSSVPLPSFCCSRRVAPVVHVWRGLKATKTYRRRAVLVPSVAAGYRREMLQRMLATSTDVTYNIGLLVSKIFNRHTRLYNVRFRKYVVTASIFHKIVWLIRFK